MANAVVQSEFPPAVANTLAWLQRSVAQYYRKHPIPSPPRMQRREYGYMLWPKQPGPPPFIRHRAYGSEEAFRQDVDAIAPHSAYYSTAYYRRPWEARMADKDWMAAELIFDLDADHLDEVKAAEAAKQPLDVERQLHLVKRAFQRLLDDFLFGDFGLKPEDVTIAFSGGRGYHAHVTDERLQRLDARGRRELVDYITAKFPTVPGTKDPDLSIFITEETLRVEKIGKHVRKVTAERMAPSTATGWPGRMTRTLVATLQQNVLDNPEPEAVAWLTRLDGIGDEGARKFRASLTPERLERISRGHIEQGPIVKRVLRHLIRQAVVPLARGETDEPVTADVKRLIRLPGSLHGKTGLRAVPLTEAEFDRFEPLRDAVAFPLDAVAILPRSDANVKLGGETVSVKGGERTEVPMAHAFWLCARQQATLA